MESFPHGGDAVLRALDSAVWLAVDAVAASGSAPEAAGALALATLERAIAAIGPAAAPTVARLFRLYWLCVAEKAEGDPAFLDYLRAAYGAAVGGGGGGGKAAVIAEHEEEQQQRPRE